MHQAALFVSLAALAAASAVAQANLVSGLQGSLLTIEDATYYGRRGPAHPGGEVGMCFSYYMCNPGSVAIEWFKPQGPSSRVMDHRHPTFGFMVVRVHGGRIEQITDRRTYAKHAHGAGNGDGLCGTCIDPGVATYLGVHCYDAYSDSTNSNRFWLAPDDEIDPWLGAWNPYGSYFDRGDPEVAFPQNQDGLRSLLDGIYSDPVKNRITLREADLLLPGQFYYALQIVLQGEHRDLRLDNIGYRRMLPSWSGSTWSFADSGSTTIGSVLDAWPGAAVSHARNGADDGHFFVGVLVTPAGPGNWHYEYAVHDVDNRRGAASLRIPLCRSTALQNVSFRDPDQDPLNDWTWSRVGDELVFQAGANALRWNMLFNFAFDCAVPPVAGTVALDQALPGPGALQVAVATQVPGGSALVTNVGPGCGAPSPLLSASGLPTIPQPGFQLALATTPAAGLMVFGSLQQVDLPLGGGCRQYLGSSTLFTHGFLFSNAAGLATVPLAIPNLPALDGLRLVWQAAQVVPGGVMFGNYTLSNGLLTRLGCR